MAKNDVQKLNDRPRSRGGSTAISIGGGGAGGTVDLTPYLLLDGSRAMTGSLNMGNFSITNIALVDGVDISAHVVDPNAHHARLHDLDSTSDHTGTLAWAKVNKSGSNITDIVTRLHNTMQGIGPNDHHNQVHSIVGSDHTVVGSIYDIIALSATNTLSVITTYHTPGVAARHLRTNTDGSLTIERLYGVQFVKSSAYIEATTYVSAPTYVNTPKVQNTGNVTLEPTVDVFLNPGSNLAKLMNGKAIQTESFASGFAGNGFRLDQGMTTAGITTLQLDDIFVRGRMHVYELLIQQIRATNGSIFVSSVAKIKTVTANGGASYTLTTDAGSGSVGNEAHGFLVGDLIRAQRTKWNGSTFAGVYQSNMQVTAVSGLYSFTATLTSGDAPAAGYEFVRLGSVSNASRQGSIYLTSDDASAPFIDVLNDVDAFADWNTAAVAKMRIGKLDGITGGSNEYGFIAGAGGYSNSVKYIKASNLGVRLNNVDLQLWNSGTQRVNIDNLGSDVWFKDSGGNVKLSWNGSTLNVVGTITITSGSGYANFSDKPTSLSGINSTEGTKLSGIAAGATVGATWGTNLYSIPTRFGDAPSTSGLYMTATNMGFYNGSAWKMWMDNSGYFYFGASTNESLRWDGSKLGGYDSSNNLQWAAGNVGGFVGFSAGIYSSFAYTRLDANGLRVYRPTWYSTSGAPEPTYGTNPNTAPDAYTTWELLDTSVVWTHNYPSQVYTATYGGNTVLRMYASSKHIVPTTEEWGAWFHYYDGVIEIPTPNLYGFGGGYTRRLWLKSDKLYIDGDVYAPLKTFSAMNFKVEGATAEFDIFDRDGDGQVWVLYHSGGILRLWNPTYSDMWRLSYNGDINHTGNSTHGGYITASNYIRAEAGFYNDNGYYRCNGWHLFTTWAGSYQGVGADGYYAHGGWMDSQTNTDMYFKRSGTNRIGLFSWGVYTYGNLTTDGVFSLQTVYTSSDKPIAPSAGIKIYLYNDAGVIKLAGRFAGSSDHKFILNP